MPGSFHFVGGHPMAGSEKSGYMASSPHLFENAYYIITPCSKSSGNDVEILTEIIKALGGIPIKLSASLHDKVTGAISHVPHIISAALVKLVQELDSPEQYMQKLAAGGFKDITRISSSNPEMWHNICFSNRESVIKILDDYIEILINFKKSLSTDDDEKVFNYFKNAKEYRDSFTSRMNGLIPGTYELIIDVADKPGIIGEVATTLGNNDINIKNINITNSREFEGGVLIVTLSDSTSLEKAELILSACDYKIIKRK
jgi:prephenate dehydrogenase